MEDNEDASESAQKQNDKILQRFVSKIIEKNLEIAICNGIRTFKTEISDNKKIGNTDLSDFFKIKMGSFSDDDGSGPIHNSFYKAFQTIVKDLDVQKMKPIGLTVIDKPIEGLKLGIINPLKRGLLSALDINKNKNKIKNQITNDYVPKAPKPGIIRKTITNLPGNIYNFSSNLTSRKKTKPNDNDNENEATTDKNDNDSTAVVVNKSTIDGNDNDRTDVVVGNNIIDENVRTFEKQEELETQKGGTDKTDDAKPGETQGAADTTELPAPEKDEDLDKMLEEMVKSLKDILTPDEATTKKMIRAGFNTVFTKDNVLNEFVDSIIYFFADNPSEINIMMIEILSECIYVIYMDNGLEKDKDYSKFRDNILRALNKKCNVDYASITQKDKDIQTKKEEADAIKERKKEEAKKKEEDAIIEKQRKTKEKEDAAVNKKKEKEANTKDEFTSVVV